MFKAKEAGTIGIEQLTTNKGKIRSVFRSNSLLKLVTQDNNRHKKCDLQSKLKVSGEY